MQGEKALYLDLFPSIYLESEGVYMKDRNCKKDSKKILSQILDIVELGTNLAKEKDLFGIFKKISTFLEKNFQINGKFILLFDRDRFHLLVGLPEERYRIGESFALSEFPQLGHLSSGSKRPCHSQMEFLRLLKDGQKLNPSFPVSVFPLYSGKKVFGVFGVEMSKLNNGISKIVLQFLAGQLSLYLYHSKPYFQLLSVAKRMMENQKLLAERVRISAVGERSAKIAHKLRNPLLTIGGFAQMILKHIDPSDPNRKRIEVIIQEVKKLEQTLDKMLYSSYIGGFGVIPINPIVEEVIKSYSGYFEKKGVSLSVSLSPYLPLVWVDGNWLKSILKRVLRSIFRFSGQTGGMVNILTYEKEGSVIVDIEAKGLFIPEDFFSVKNDPFVVEDVNYEYNEKRSIRYRFLDMEKTFVDFVKEKDGVKIFIKLSPIG